MQPGLTLYTEEDPARKSRQIIPALLFNATCLFILFYFYNWYFLPEKSFSRLPYCVRELFFEPLTELDGSDGAISAMFVSRPFHTHHIGYAYGVLQFNQDGTVTNYSVGDMITRQIRVRHIVSWMNWYEDSSLSVDDVPVFIEPIGGGWSWKIYMDFFVYPPRKGTYTIQDGDITIKWDKEQKWYPLDTGKLWTGVLAGEELNIVRYHTGTTFDETLNLFNYNTCPYSKSTP